MMKGSVYFTMLGSGIVCILLASVSEAAAPRAFVSTRGSDENSCSAAQPCRSFNRALTIVDESGEIVVQDSGGYSSGFTITQSVTIDAGGFNASVTSSTNADLCTITAGAADRVVLRGISFHGAGVGSNAINATQVGSLYVEHCSITEFKAAGVRMVNGGKLFVTNTDFRACGNEGIFALAGATPLQLVGHDSRFTECGFAGVLVRTTSTGAVTGWLTNCTAALCPFGFEAESASAANTDLTLTNCRAIGNNNHGVGATTFSTGSVTVRMANCIVTKNGTGISASSGGGGTAAVLGTSPGTNVIDGNGSGNAIVAGQVLQ
jgi:hypothetical protein